MRKSNIMRTVALVSCSKTKLNLPAQAKDMYTSSLFRKSRAWAERNCDSWYVLSAKYHLLSPATVIKRYDRTLGKMSKQAREQWAQTVYKQMKNSGLLRRGVKLIWLAGANYQRPLARLLNGVPSADPLLKRKIGERLQWLDRHLAPA